MQGLFNRSIIVTGFLLASLVRGYDTLDNRQRTLCPGGLE